MINDLSVLYEKIMALYGPQGWWPNITADGDCSYTPGDVTKPSREEQFHIIIGTILTQNTSWKQVERSLKALHDISALEPKALLETADKKIKKAIRPAGYFNQKCERLKTVAKWFLKQQDIPSRNELLAIKGIGPETADSILLYAYHIPSFVIDTYTKRILQSHCFLEGTETYNQIKNFIENNIQKDVVVYQEFHALIVKHAKMYYTRTTPEDPLLDTK
ncbi:MAG: endonuclease III domain-containing protein [Nanobdellota archaeon]